MGTRFRPVYFCIFVHLTVAAPGPGNIEYPLSIKFTGFHLEPAVFGRAPTDALGALETPWQFGGMSPPTPQNDFSVIAVAKADVVRPAGP